MGLDFFYIISPEATINLMTDPSCESVSWTAGAGSIALNSTYQTHGNYSLAYTPSSGTTDGCYIAVSLTSGTTYTYSIDVLGALGVPYRIYFATTAPAVKGTPTSFTGTGDWQRVEVTWTADSTTTFRLYVGKNSSSNTSPYYIDSVQLEDKAHSTTYVDGDMINCGWRGTPHASQSIREWWVRSGGTKVYLSDNGFYVSSVSGIGSPIAILDTAPTPSGVGASLTSQRISERQVVINMSVNGSDSTEWNQRLSALYDLVRGDFFDGKQPFTLGYTYGQRQVELDCFYEDGLALDSDQLMDMSAVSLRLRAPFPYWREVRQEGSVVPETGSLTYSTTDNVWGLGRSFERFGKWYPMFASNSYAAGSYNELLGTTRSIAITKSGRVYGGSVGHINPAMGSQYYLSYISTEPSTGLTDMGLNNPVYCVNALPNSNIIGVAGSFTNAGGNAAADYFTFYDGSSWIPLTGGGSTNNTIYTCTPVDHTTMLIGGVATNIAGNTCHYGQATSSGSFSAGSAVTGGSAVIYASAVDPRIYDGVRYGYIGGNFTAVGGTSATNVCKLTLTTFPPTRTAMGSGIPETVHKLVFASDGCLYAAASNKTYGTASFDTTSRTSGGVYQWNGYSWRKLPESNYCSILFLDTDDMPVAFFGNYKYTTYSDAYSFRFQKWNGSRWERWDRDPGLFVPGTSQLAVAGAVDKRNNSLVMAWAMNSTMDSYDEKPLQGWWVTVTNTGSAPAYPVMKFFRTGDYNYSEGYIFEIVNRTNKKRIVFKPAISIYKAQASGDLALVVDLRPGQKRIWSPQFGDMTYAVAPESDLQTFCLEPGNNEVCMPPLPGYYSPGVNSLWYWDIIHTGSYGA